MKHILRYAAILADMKTGTYTVEVRSRHSGASGKEIKTLKKGGYEKTVSVTA